MPSGSFWDSAAHGQLSTYGGVFVGAVLPLTVFVGLTALLGVIHTAGRTADSVAIDPSGWLMRALALLYAGFVVGTGGVLPSIELAAPIAFAVGLVLMSTCRDGSRTSSRPLGAATPQSKPRSSGAAGSARICGNARTRCTASTGRGRSNARSSTHRTANSRPRSTH